MGLAVWLFFVSLVFAIVAWVSFTKDVVGKRQITWGVFCLFLILGCLIASFAAIEESGHGKLARTDRLAKSEVYQVIGAPIKLSASESLMILKDRKDRVRAYRFSITAMPSSRVFRVEKKKPFVLVPFPAFSDSLSVAKFR